MLLVCATPNDERTHKIVYLMHDKGKYIIGRCVFFFFHSNSLCLFVVSLRQSSKSKRIHLISCLCKYPKYAICKGAKWVETSNEMKKTEIIEQNDKRCIFIEYFRWLNHWFTICVYLHVVRSAEWTSELAWDEKGDIDIACDDLNIILWTTRIT